MGRFAPDAHDATSVIALRFGASGLIRSLVAVPESEGDPPWVPAGHLHAHHMLERDRQLPPTSAPKRSDIEQDRVVRGDCDAKLAATHLNVDHGAPDRPSPSQAKPRFPDPGQPRRSSSLTDLRVRSTQHRLVVLAGARCRAASCTSPLVAIALPRVSCARPRDRCDLGQPEWRICPVVTA